MASTKRQQARNERALQDISQNVPGNNKCADCSAPNPSWASWNLGIFLCMRCAGLHRKLGTHISKVKSLSMDSWSVEQVENMKKIGNTNSNRQLNPRNVSAKIPIDVDEVEAAYEKHIRQKYEHQAFSGERSAPSTRQNTGSTAAASDEPPPLPPKPGRHWGFTTRSASSTLPSTKKHDLPEAPITSAITVEQSRSKRGFFGMRVTSVGNNFDQKLNMLKEMGFTNTKQNQDILRNVDGSLDRAVEILGRLNETGNDVPESKPIAPVSRTTTPGLKLTKTRSSQPESAWEVKESKRSATAPLPPLPTRSQSTEPVTNNWNPFLQPQPAQDLTASMQNMAITHPQQSFTQAPLTVQTTANPWSLYLQPQQAMSVPAISQQYQSSPINNTNPFFQTASPQSFTSSNPWSQQMTPQAMTPSTPHSNPFGLPMFDANQSTMPQQPAQTPAQQTFTQPQAALTQPPFATSATTSSPNPYQQFTSPAQQMSPYAMPATTSYFAAPPQQIAPQPTGFPQQGQSTSQQQGAVQTPFTQTGAQAPFSQSGGQSPFSSVGPQSSFTPLGGQSSFSSTSAQSAFPQPGLQHASTFPQTAASSHFPPLQTPYMQQTAAAGLMPQATGMPGVRHDKQSIMALYNYPQAGPSRQLQTLPEDSVSAPVSALSPQSGNPFAAQQVSITSHASRESRDFQAFQQDGRHSPDAFAGLSSRFMR